LTPLSSSPRLPSENCDSFLSFLTRSTPDRICGLFYLRWLLPTFAVIFPTPFFSSDLIFHLFSTFVMSLFAAVWLYLRAMPSFLPHYPSFISPQRFSLKSCKPSLPYLFVKFSVRFPSLPERRTLPHSRLFQNENMRLPPLSLHLALTFHFFLS